MSKADYNFIYCAKVQFINNNLQKHSQFFIFELVGTELASTAAGSTATAAVVVVMVVVVVVVLM
jgi:hypothetical protein